MGDIPQWAFDRADGLAASGRGIPVAVGYQRAFAAYIAAHEEPPVDPLRKEALGIVLAEAVTRTDNQIAAIRSGQAGYAKVDLVLTAIRRGIELAKSGAA